MSSPSQWTIAIHEAGHAAVAIALGGSADLVTLHDASGLCWHSDLDRHEDALVAVAGPIAQELLSDVPAPQALPESEASPLPCGLQESHRQTLLAKSEQHVGESNSDERSIALWAIQDCEHQPEVWARHVERLKQCASAIVENHRSQIVAIATALYHQRFLLRNEIEAAFHSSQIETEKDVCLSQP